MSLDPGEITSADISPVANILGTQIADGTIQTRNIASKAIINTHIVDETITIQQLDLTSIGGPRAYVSSDSSNGDYTDIQSAIDYVNGLGGGEVFVREGAYTTNNNITLHSNITLHGENSSTEIIFNGFYNISATGSGSYTTGTVAVTTGSKTVTGTGTTWLTHLTTSHKIVIAGSAYSIAAVTSNTSITLTTPYFGATASGLSYRAAVYASNTVVENFTIIAASSSAIVYDYCYLPTLSNLVIVAPGTSGLLMTNCIQPVVDTMVVIGAGGVGISATNTDLITMTRCLSNGSASHGFLLNNCTNVVMESCPAMANGGDGFNVTDGSNYAWSICAASQNTGNGIKLAGGVAGGNITGGYQNNGGDGVVLAGTTSFVIIGSFGVFTGNTGYGVNISAAGCVANTIVGNIFSSNTAGAITNSGTATLRRDNNPDDTTNNDFILDTSTTLASNSDARIATQKAVKAYVDAIGTGGTASKWTTARNLAGNSVDGSANVPFANKFVVQGTTDIGLSGAQFLGALGTGLVKNTTTTGVLSIAVNSDLPAMSATVGGAVPTPPNNTTTFLRGDATWAVPPGGGSTITGPGSSVNNDIVTFSGTAGNVVQDSGKLLPTGTVVGTTDAQTQTNKVVSDVFMGGSLMDGTVAHSAVLLASNKFVDVDHLEISSTSSLEIPSTSSLEVKYYIEQASILTTLLPPGAIWMTASSAGAPNGWLQCAGQAVGRAAYVALFQAIGTQFGVGDGVTTFNVPDFRGRMPLGIGTGTAAGATAWGTVGTQPTSGAGGEQTHVLSTAEMPSHTHIIGVSGTAAAGSPFGNTTVNALDNQVTSGATGGGGSHNILPPISVVYFIIKT